MNSFGRKRSVDGKSVRVIRGDCGTQSIVIKTKCKYCAFKCMCLQVKCPSLYHMNYYLSSTLASLDSAIDKYSSVMIESFVIVL